MLDPLLRLATAAAIGLVVGVERGWHERKAAAGQRTAGVRTFTLCGLLGGVSAALAQAFESPAVLIFSGLAYTAVFAAFKYREMAEEEDYSVTTVIAAMLVFALGAYAVAGEPRVAGAAAIATAGLLAARNVLHRLVRNLTWPELRSALVLLAMSVIVLPLLPDRALDPYGSLNPRQIWLFMVLTATVSFAGYVAVKMAGPRKGILISALAGALVSSTAVTLAFARRAAAGEPAPLLAGGASLAAMVSLMRVLVISAVVAPQVLLTLAPPTLAAAATFGGLGLLLMRRVRKSDMEDLESPQNPFDLAPLAAFAGLFGIVSLISGVLIEAVGPESLYLVNAVAGIVDVDVPSLNAARLAGSGLTLEAAALAILIALGANGLGRVGFAAAAGTRAFTLRLLGATLAAAIAAIGVLLVVKTLS